MRSLGSMVSSPPGAYWRDELRADVEIRRALLRAGLDGAPLQDDMDCAEVAFTCGRREMARMLYGLVFLRVGFSATGLAFQRDVGARTGLWGEMSAEPRRPLPMASGFSVDLAIIELRGLMALKAAAPMPAEVSWSLAGDSQARRIDPPMETTLASSVGRVSASLQDVPQLEANGSLPEVLRDLADELESLPPVRLEACVGESLERLAMTHAVMGLRRFLLETRDLIDATGPCVPLFQEAGRLDPSVLGPYFANLRLIIRSARDIFGLIELASGGKLTNREVQGWCVLLSGRLPVAEMLSFIEELGDRGMTETLRAVLIRASKQAPTPQWREVLWRIRDCCLDIGELAVAADAQHLIALRDPLNAVEWTILGDIRGSLEDRTAAEGAFGRCLLLNPHDETPRHRITALRSGSFDAFKVYGGYTTSPARRRLRRARAQAYRQAVSDAESP